MKFREVGSRLAVILHSKAEDFTSMLRFSAAILLFGSATVCTALGGSIIVFNTGENSGGTALPLGQTDLHYSLISAPSGVPLTAITTSPHGRWTGNTGTTDWLTPGGDANVAEALGNYDYRTTFDLAGMDPNTAELSGSWTSDNNGCIYLNGGNTGNCTAFESFASLLPFSIKSGFHAGVNTLDFMITNGHGSASNPTGLFVDLSGTASASSGTPEPSSLLLMGAGIVSLLCIPRRRHRAGHPNSN